MAADRDITIINAKSQATKEKPLDTHLKEENLKEQAKNARDFFSSIQDELNQRNDSIKDGLSFLDLKNDTLLSYMIDVCNVLLKQVRGESISGCSSVDRCIEYRVILEKIKSIDQKLAYQLNKLITMPDSETNLDEQGINIKNLDIELDGVESDDENVGKEDSESPLEDDDDEEDEGDDDEIDSEETEGKKTRDSEEEEEGEDEEDLEESSEDEDEEDLLVQKHVPRKPIDRKNRNKSKGNEKPKGGIYKPPKLRSVAYTEEHERGGNSGRRKTHADFYRDDDEDEMGDFVEATRRQKDDERTRFEEDNYTRLADDNPRREKRKIKTKEYRKKGRNNKFKRRKR